jgi:DNA-binding XRE family transcriptional regulator
MPDNHTDERAENMPKTVQKLRIGDAQMCGGSPPMRQLHPTRMPVPFLHAWRLRRGFSQQELAELAGMSKTTIVNLERAKGGANFVSIRKLAAALAISREELLFHDPNALAATPPIADRGPIQ